MKIADLIGHSSRNLRVGHLSIYATLNWAWKTALSSVNDGSAYATHVPTNAASGAGNSLQVAPPATLWAVLDDLFNIRQPTLLQLERFRERKQLPGESVDQFLGALRDLATRVYAVEDRTKVEAELLQQFILGVSHLGLKAELIRRSPDNIRDAIQLARSYEATSELEPQLHAVKITADPRPRQLLPGTTDEVPRALDREEYPACTPP
ncbi:hypothetical protein T265_05794 [Opisthorchis viverrini]|uniref:Retrotransposon gag domain-containing protein n=1 Tax=Opisthorchis viverrini TaxID=6198 RepID=A0A074ZUP2_OPIVI|nr:hypothetical protein T265_05794 [Opisthorchis viverrini]KER27100.1 hypothetical protein T265_05794 [Opisthorchis viverrini]